jgi:hypothetical protein
MDPIGMQGNRKVRFDSEALEPAGMFEEMCWMLTLSGTGNYEPIHRISERPQQVDAHHLRGRTSEGWFSTSAISVRL